MSLLVLALLLIVLLTLVVTAAVARTRWGLTPPLLLLGGIFMLLIALLGFARHSRQVTVRRIPEVTISARNEAASNQSLTTAAVEEISEVDTDSPVDSSDEFDEPAILLEAEEGKSAKIERPAWVERDSVQVGDTYQVSVASGPLERLAECRATLDQQLERQVAAYIDKYLESATPGVCRASDIVMYDLGYIRKHLVKPGGIFEEKLRLSFGPMYQSHALLEFGPEFRDELDGRRSELEQYARDVAVAGRLRGLAVAFGTVLSLLLVGLVWFHRRTQQSVG